MCLGYISTSLNIERMRKHVTRNTGLSCCIAAWRNYCLDHCWSCRWMVSRRHHAWQRLWAPWGSHCWTHWCFYRRSDLESSCSRCNLWLLGQPHRGVNRCVYSGCHCTCRSKGAHWHQCVITLHMSGDAGGDAKPPASLFFNLLAILFLRLISACSKAQLRMMVNTCMVSQSFLLLTSLSDSHLHWLS